MAAFPSYAKVLAGPFGMSRASAVDRTSMEDGFVKQSKVRARVLVKRKIQVMLLTQANYNSFILWFQGDINYGADWFDWVDPVDGVTKLARIVSQLNDETPVGGMITRWIIGFDMETWSG